MNVTNRKWKKGLITKTWQRCTSINSGGSGGSKLMMKSRSWPHSGGGDEEKRTGKRRLAPEGCFSVYVGPEKQRFVIKTEHANHPLFKMLLEEAESEYGYISEGPLALPCDVEFFCKVLVEMEHSDEIHHGCGLGKAYSSYSLLSPYRTLIAMNKL